MDISQFICDLLNIDQNRNDNWEKLVEEDLTIKVLPCGLLFVDHNGTTVIDPQTKNAYFINQLTLSGKFSSCRKVKNCQLPDLNGGRLLAMKGMPHAVVLSGIGDATKRLQSMFSSKVKDEALNLLNKTGCTNKDCNSVASKMHFATAHCGGAKPWVRTGGDINYMVCADCGDKQIMQRSLSESNSMVCACGHEAIFIAHLDYDKANLSHVPYQFRNIPILEWYGAIAGQGDMIIGHDNRARWSGIDIVL